MRHYGSDGRERELPHGSELSKDSLELVPVVGDIGIIDPVVLTSLKLLDDPHANGPRTSGRRQAAYMPKKLQPNTSANILSHQHSWKLWRICWQEISRISKKMERIQRTPQSRKMKAYSISLTNGEYLGDPAEEVAQEELVKNDIANILEGMVEVRGVDSAVIGVVTVVERNA